MQEILLILYFVGMVLVPITRARDELLERTIFLTTYFLAAIMVAIWSPFPFTETLALVFLPVLLSLLFSVIAGKKIFRMLHIVINLIVLGLVTNMMIYSPEPTLTIFIIIAVFTFLPYKQRQRG